MSFFSGFRDAGSKGPRRANVDTTKLYKALGIEQDAKDADIKKAYRKLAMKHHPDKGGDPDKFKEISRAYEVLSDAEKRKVYDRYGEEGLDSSNQGGGEEAGNPFDLFQAFFGGGAGRRSTRRRKTQTIEYTLNVSLEDLYNGCTRKVAIKRQVVDKDQGVKVCTQCDGRGIQVEVQRTGSMLRQMQTECRSCGGKGKIFSMKLEREVFDIPVQKGSPNQHQVVFREKAHEHPGMDTGDFVVVLQEQAHPLFKRRGADLFIERKISLVEALCGFDFDLTHLDGRKLLIKTSPGEVVKSAPFGSHPLIQDYDRVEWDMFEDADCPSIGDVAQVDTADAAAIKEACEKSVKRQGIDAGAFVVDGQRGYIKQCSREEALQAKVSRKGCTMYVLADPTEKKPFRMMKAVKEEGMPTYNSPFVHGNLFLILSIEFPDSIPAESQDAIRKLLPPPLHKSELNETSDGVEVHTVTDIDPVWSYNSNKENMQPRSRL